MERAISHDDAARTSIPEPEKDGHRGKGAKKRVKVEKRLDVCVWMRAFLRVCSSREVQFEDAFAQVFCVVLLAAL